MEKAEEERSCSRKHKRSRMGLRRWYDNKEEAIKAAKHEGKYVWKVQNSGATILTRWYVFYRLPKSLKSTKYSVIEEKLEF